jgi:hypothetical protein
MTAPSLLYDVLRATGFLIGQEPAPGLAFSTAESKGRARFQPDAIWRDRSNLEVFFKFASSALAPRDIASWHREAWNFGVAPLLWIVSPQRIELYNTFQRPDSLDDARSHLLGVFQVLEQELARLDEYAGRLSMLSGQFWSHENRMRREGRVDLQLLRDLQTVEDQLCSDDYGLRRNVAQGLLGRSIFIRYLTDRGIVTAEILKEFGSEQLNSVLSSREQAYQLFDWIRSTFNGDLFPVEAAERKTVRSKYLRLVAETLAGVSPSTGQGSLWPYKFDVIPIELISSIYEQFAHAGDNGDAETEGVHYTPIAVVNLILDEVMRDLKPGARVLDMTCGSGVFLVEALRRLVQLQANGRPPSRQLIRKTMKEQIFGVDKNEAAVRVASFSLYLTALELDPDPRPPKALRFEPLIGRNLFIADAFALEKDAEARRLCDMRFEAIVGNPPWTYASSEDKPSWPPGREPLLPPRSQDFAFVWRSIDFAHADTRFGIVMRATPFFSSAAASERARNALFRKLAPIALVNLSALRDELFPTADYPAVVLLSRLHNQPETSIIPVISVPWTSTFSRSGAFEISPTDVRFASMDDINQSSHVLKMVALGTPRDRLLMRQIANETLTLAATLDALGLKFVTGVQLLAGDQNDASHLVGLPLLGSGDLQPRIDPESLSVFSRRKIHRPRGSLRVPRSACSVRGRVTQGPSCAVGFSDSDLVYTESFYGLSTAGKDRSETEVAPCLAGILQSALASWYLLLTASEFGIHKRKLLLQDILQVPIPHPDRLHSEQSRAVAAAVRALDAQTHSSFEQGVAQVDEAVFDLFGLDDHARLVVKEGLARAEREYVGARLLADQPISVSDLNYYSQAFLQVLNAWSGVLGRQKYDAEIFNVRSDAALRIIRFVVQGKGEVRWINLTNNLNDAIGDIGKRMRLPIAERLGAVRELRVHADGELLVIKPAARRFWAPAAGLNDTDAALGDGLGVSST